MQDSVCVNVKFCREFAFMERNVLQLVGNNWSVLSHSSLSWELHMHTFHVNILFIQIHHPKIHCRSRPFCTDSHLAVLHCDLNKMPCHWGLPVVTFILGMKRFCAIFNNTFCPYLFGRFVIFMGLCSNRTGLRLAHV